MDKVDILLATYNGENYGDGKSYIYGPVSIHEKEWLRHEGIESKKNVCHVLSLSNQKENSSFSFSITLYIFG